MTRRTLRGEVSGVSVQVVPHLVTRWATYADFRLDQPPDRRRGRVHREDEMRPGRMVRALMRPDPPGTAAERIRHRRAADQAHAEMLARYSPLSPEVMPAALAWQDQRIAELMAESAPRRCASCAHPHHPHSVCSGRSGGTAYRCGCVCSEARAR